MYRMYVFDSRIIGIYASECVQTVEGVGGERERTKVHIYTFMYWDLDICGLSICEIQIGEVHNSGKHRIEHVLILDKESMGQNASVNEYMHTQY